MPPVVLSEHSDRSVDNISSLSRVSSTCLVRRRRRLPGSRRKALRLFRSGTAKLGAREHPRLRPARSQAAPSDQGLGHHWRHRFCKLRRFKKTADARSVGDGRGSRLKHLPFDAGAQVSRRHLRAHRAACRSAIHCAQLRSPQGPVRQAEVADVKSSRAPRRCGDRGCECAGRELLDHQLIALFAD